MLSQHHKLGIAEIHGDHSGLHGASLQISNEAIVIGRQQIAREDPKGVLNHRLHRRRLYFTMHHIACNPSQPRIFLPSA